MFLLIFIWLFTIALILAIISGIQKAVQRSNEELDPRLSRWFAVFTALWISYITIIAYTGILNDLSFPPRLPVFIILPIFLMMGVFLTRDATSIFCKNLETSWLIGFQSFRIIVELIIWQGFREGILPVETTFEGLNYDVVVGITAIPVAFYTNKQKLSKPFLILWNVFGLIILANTVRVFISAAYFPATLGFNEPIVNPDFLKPPYIFIAAIFMPFAVFLHALTLKKILEK